MRPDQKTLMAFPDASAIMFTVKNGIARRRTGAKYLVFEPETLGLRPIGFAASNRSNHEKGTYQIAINGDLIVSIKWGRKSTEYDMQIFGKEWMTIEHSKKQTLWTRLHQIHPWVEAWLKPEGRGSIWIPEEVSSERNYLSIIIKSKLGE